MMSFRITRSAGILILVFFFFLPLRTFAQYLSPEEVLWELESIYPPSPRDAQDRVGQQMKQSASRREKEQEEFFAAQKKKEEENSNDADLVDVVASLEDAINTLLEEDQNPENRRTERLLQRVEEHQNIVLVPQQSKNSGAPLIGTGLASTLAVLSLIGAGMWTMRKARQLEA